MKVKVFTDEIYSIGDGIFKVKSNAWEEFEKFISENPDIKIISHTHTTKPVYVPLGEHTIFKNKTKDIISILYED